MKIFKIDEAVENAVLKEASENTPYVYVNVAFDDDIYPNFDASTIGVTTEPLEQEKTYNAVPAKEGETYVIYANSEDEFPKIETIAEIMKEMPMNDDCSFGKITVDPSSVTSIYDVISDTPKNEKYDLKAEYLKAIAGCVTLEDFENAFRGFLKDETEKIQPGSDTCLITHFYWSYDDLNPDVAIKLFTDFMNGDLSLTDLLYVGLCPGSDFGDDGLDIGDGRIVTYRNGEVTEIPFSPEVRKEIEI